MSEILSEGERFKLYNGDCLDVMKEFPDNSISSIIADLPYGTTSCAWDSIIPFEPMWAQFKRVIKPRGAIVLFASQPFTSALVMSNVGWFKYAWTWDKHTGKGHLVAKYRPLQQTEDICVFGKGAVNYYPITTKRDSPKMLREGKRTEIMGGNKLGEYERETDFWYPKTVLDFCWSPTQALLHPTQKPHALLEYLVRTYTLEGDVVLDPTMGSGTTGAACMTTKRRFVGIEMDESYFASAEKRIRASVTGLDTKYKLTDAADFVEDLNFGLFALS